MIAPSEYSAMDDLPYKMTDGISVSSAHFVFKTYALSYHLYYTSLKAKTTEVCHCVSPPPSALQNTKFTGSTQ